MYWAFCGQSVDAQDLGLRTRSSQVGPMQEGQGFHLKGVVKPPGVTTCRRGKWEVLDVCLAHRLGLTSGRSANHFSESKGFPLPSCFARKLFALFQCFRSSDAVMYVFKVREQIDDAPELWSCEVGWG